MFRPYRWTKEFIKKIPEFTINLALVCKNKYPYIYIVSCPPLGKIYYGYSNHGSYLLSKGVTKILLVPNSIDNLKIVCSRSHLNKETEQYLKNGQILKK